MISSSAPHWSGSWLAAPAFGQNDGMGMDSVSEMAAPNWLEKG